MKRIVWLSLAAIVIVAALLFNYYVGTYNKLQILDESVNSDWAQIDNQLKRRNDLIPNLVQTVKGYSSHEKEVLANVSDARAKLAGSMNSKDVKAISKDSEQLSSALSRLLVVVEQYPNLKADKSFVALQDELAGTENRIAVARKDYNLKVKVYNAIIRTFPTSVVAKIAGMQQREYYQISSEDKKVPEVKFD